MQKNDFINKLKFLEESGICDFMSDSPINHYNNATKKIGVENKSVSTPSKNVGDIDNLKDLKRAVFNFNECELKKTAKNNNRQITYHLKISILNLRNASSYFLKSYDVF